MNNLKYEFLAGYGSIGTKKDRYGDDMNIQLCRERWYGYESYAIRCFDVDGKPNKGIGLKADQLKKLRDILNTMDLDEGGKK